MRNKLDSFSNDIELIESKLQPQPKIQIKITNMEPANLKMHKSK
jgi:hypothetical protein